MSNRRRQGNPAAAVERVSAMCGPATDPTVTVSTNAKVGNRISTSKSVGTSFWPGKRSTRSVGGSELKIVTSMGIEKECVTSIGNKKCSGKTVTTRKLARFSSCTHTASSRRASSGSPPSGRSHNLNSRTGNSRRNTSHSPCCFGGRGGRSWCHSRVATPRGRENRKVRDSTSKLQSLSDARAGSSHSTVARISPGSSGTAAVGGMAASATNPGSYRHDDGFVSSSQRVSWRCMTCSPSASSNGGIAVSPGELRRPHAMLPIRSLPRWKKRKAPVHAEKSVNAGARPENEMSAATTGARDLRT